jgi:iron complex outermembrane receptor protein
MPGKISGFLAASVAFAALGSLPRISVADDLTFPAQTLSESLRALGNQTKTNMLFDPAVTGSVTAPAVSNAGGFKDALVKLLAGSGLTFQFIDERTVTVIPEARVGSDPPPAARVQGSGKGMRLAQADAPVGAHAQAVDRGASNGTASSSTEESSGKIQEIIVEGTRLESGSKSETFLIETPRSVSVVTADQIDLQGVDEVAAAMRYTPGVFAEYRGTDTTRQTPAVRGFINRDAHMIYRDGMRARTSAQAHPDPDVFLLERMEIIRGPASALYGQNGPGGLIYTVTKRPTEEFFAEVEASAGSFSKYGGKLDFGGPIDAEGRFLYRFTGLVRDGDAQMDHLKEGRWLVAPAFTWRASDSTSLTFLAHFQKDDTHQGYGIPASGSFLDNPNGRISDEFFPGEPGFDRYEKDAASVGYFLEHTFANDWVLRHRVRYEDIDLAYDGINAVGFAPGSDRILSRISFVNVNAVSSLTSDNNLMMKFGSDAASHDVLLGLDYNTGSIEQTSTCCTPTAGLDAFAPVYGQPVLIGPVSFAQDPDISQTGLYMQDQIKLLDRWIITLGGRYDWAETEIENGLTGLTTSQKDSKFSGQAGLLRLFENGFAPYVSVATSFEVLFGRKFSGDAFDPTTGKQVEVGLKYQPKGSANFITVSAFDAKQQNLTTPDLEHLGFNMQTGELQSRGIEAEARGRFGNLNVTAAYSLTDAEITRSNTVNLGMRPTLVPKNVASVWGDYLITDGGLRGLGFGAGVRYSDYTFGDQINTIKVPSITLADAVLYYDFQGSMEGTRMAVNLSNLFDESYVSACLSATACYFGAQRNVTASIRYHW